MAFGGGENSDRKLMSEINVTPLVDVMLVLLIIFMVTAPLLQEGIRVNLPKTDTSQIVEQKEENLVLTIDQAGGIYIGNEKSSISIDELRNKLKEIYSERLNKDLYLKADKDVNYGIVVKTMSEIQKVGFIRLGLITEHKGKTKR